MRLIPSIILCIIVCGGTCASAERERLGLNAEAGSRSSVGLTYRLHDQIAVRPAFAFTELKADNVPTLIEPGEDFPTFQTTERVIQTGVGVLFYIWGSEKSIRPYVGLDTYLGFRNLPYQTLENGLVVYKNGSLRYTSYRGLAGVELHVIRHLSVYGEAGLEYATGERFAFGGQKLHTRLLGSFTSGIGVIFFFW